MFLARTVMPMRTALLTLAHFDEAETKVAGKAVSLYGTSIASVSRFLISALALCGKRKAATSCT